MDIAVLTQELKALIVSALNLEGKSASDIDASAPLFGEGLGLDSLDALELAMAVEEKYGVRLPDGDAAKAVFASVAALVTFIVGAKANQPNESTRANADEPTPL